MRGWFVDGRYLLDGRMHRAWWRWSDTGLPLWPWRWLCWLEGGHKDDSYGSCVRCREQIAEWKKDHHVRGAEVPGR